MTSEASEPRCEKEPQNKALRGANWYTRRLAPAGRWPANRWRASSDFIYLLILSFPRRRLLLFYSLPWVRVPLFFLVGLCSFFFRASGFLDIHPLPRLFHSRLRVGGACFAWFWIFWIYMSSRCRSTVYWGARFGELARLIMNTRSFKKFLKSFLNVFICFLLTVVHKYFDYDFKFEIIFD